MSVEQLSRTIEEMTESIITESIKKTEKKFEDLFDNTEKKLRELHDSVPIKHVKINSADTKKIKTKAVPYIDRLIVNAKLGLNSLLVGPAGCGKTTAARQLADALDLEFGSVCLTAGASETWLFGRQTPNGFVEASFSKLYRDGGVFLADEMDAADANLMLSINTALANGTMFNPISGETINKNEKFVFIGAANTFGKGADHVYTGRSRLDGATLDRFIVIEVDYDSDYEKSICPDNNIYNFLKKTRQYLKNDGYEEFISTRWFQYAYDMYMAGVSFTKIRDSLKSNWCEEARRICNKAYKEVYDRKNIPDVYVKPSVLDSIKDIAGSPRTLPGL